MTAKVIFIGASLLFAAGPAFADEPGAGSASGGAGAEVGVGVGAGGGSGSAAVAADATASTAAAGAWLGPQIDRPYAMAKGKIGAYGDIDVNHLSISSGMTSISATQEALHVGGAFGITDQISAGLDYGAPIAGDGTDKNAGKGPLTFFGMYQIAHDSKMSIAATADFALNLCGAADPMTGDCSSTKAIHAGLGAKYKLGPTMALYTGAPFGPGPVGQHLSISLESNGPITFSLPIGFAFQATPQIFAFAQTELFSAYLSNAPMGADSFRLIGGDIEKGGIGIPLTFGGYFGVNNQLDVGLAISFLDLGHAGDFYTIGFLGRWHN